MNDTTQPNEFRLEPIFDEFDRAWNSGQRPSIEEFLARVDGDNRTEAFGEFLKIELEYRSKLEEIFSANEYCDRFPEFQRLVEQSFPNDPSRTATFNNQVLHVPGSFQPEDVSVFSQSDRYKPTKFIGEGSFSRVYLCEDLVENRRVALKVPKSERFQSDQERLRLAREAELLTSLGHHPGIVSVYEVIIDEQSHLPVIVQEFVEGQDLEKVFKKEKCLSAERVVELGIGIANALGFAHRNGVVHRDLKPANVLIDADGQPRVVDFGLAVHESYQRLHQGEVAGTPAYMAPEQTRGQVHRLDGRTDIWSLGVMLYEAVTGRRPFYSDGSLNELFDEIQHRDPRPPRMIRDSSIGLERIILKSLSKKMRLRYQIAEDLAADLEHHDSPALTRKNVVPRGFESFRGEDAEFYLDLLSGPRNRNGLPESISFWKSQIEGVSSGDVFNVGVIYGPSGSGKSSLIKAGILPRIADHIEHVSVEATPTDTELRLIKSLRHAYPQIPDRDLPFILASIQEGNWLPKDEKLLIVIDQFEQWLQNRDTERDTQLVEALRYCDGRRIQCIVLVRDEFWLATSRFMDALEIPLVEGVNSILVDLFDEPHAVKVLTEFGRAYDRVPTGELNKEQQSFLNDSVARIAQEGKVSAVGLVLMSEMLKGKEWNSTALKNVQGLEQLGDRYFDELFESERTPIELRSTESLEVTKAVLGQLLPGPGSSLKGYLRSYSELAEATGSTDASNSLSNVLDVLHDRYRLISLTAPYEAIQDEDGERHYQLTHDFMVPALRRWLTKKRRESWRGRTEIRLAERAEAYRVSPEKKQLPSFLEWLSIKMLTKKSAHSRIEADMMRLASRMYVTRTLSFAVVIFVTTIVVSWIRAGIRHDELFAARSDEVPQLINNLAWHDRLWLHDRLRSKLSDDQVGSHEQLLSRLVLLQYDEEQLTPLLDHLLESTPDEFDLIRQLIPGSSRQSVQSKLWDLLQDPLTEGHQKLRAGVMLGDLDSESERWRDTADDVVLALITIETNDAVQWISLIDRIPRELISPLQKAFNESAQDNRNYIAAAALARYVQDSRDLSTFTRLIRTAKPSQIHVLIQGVRRYSPSDVQSAINEALSKATKVPESGNLLLAQFQLDTTSFWPNLRHKPDPSLQTYLINMFKPARIGPVELLERLETLVANSSSNLTSQDEIDSEKQALLLGLADYDFDMLPQGHKNRLPRTLTNWYKSEKDNGVHSAVELLMRRWIPEDCSQAFRELTQVESAKGNTEWIVTLSGHTMSLLSVEEEFVIQKSEMVGTKRRLVPYKMEAGHRFAISTREVTFGQFIAVLPEYEKTLKYLPGFAEQPVIGISWFDAIKYCRQLSENENLSHAYPMPEEIKEGMVLSSEVLSREGYRLPTELEWEFAARSGVVTTAWFHGNDFESLEHFVWYAENSQSSPHDVGILRPNRVGLFDVLGNAAEMTMPWFDVGSESEVVDQRTMIMKRGGTAKLPAHSVEVSSEIRSSPIFGHSDSVFGFRILRGTR